MAGVFFVTPDSNTCTSRCAFDVLSVRSVVKLFIVVTRVDRRLREVDGVVCVRQSVLCQWEIRSALRDCQLQIMPLCNETYAECTYTEDCTRMWYFSNDRYHVQLLYSIAFLLVIADLCGVYTLHAIKWSTNVFDEHVWVAQKMAQFLYVLTSSNINHFQNYFTVRIRRKLVIIFNIWWR